MQTPETKNNEDAALANLLHYDFEATQKYASEAPHIKHAMLHKLHSRLLFQVFAYAKQYTDTPYVLDIGAGEGSVTIPFLELGAKVLAVDISESQLTLLKQRCAGFGDSLEIQSEDITKVLKSQVGQFDIITASSFLHHIPDYCGLISDAVPLLSPHGQFFSFQDPLRYDTVKKTSKLFSAFAYFCWRIFQEDAWGGLRRKLRRSRGVYLAESVHDNAEYHIVRNGVDQNAIAALLRGSGFDCEIVTYFSTLSGLFQQVGSWLGMKNTFAILARKPDQPIVQRTKPV